MLLANSQDVQFNGISEILANGFMAKILSSIKLKGGGNEANT